MAETRDNGYVNDKLLKKKKRQTPTTESAPREINSTTIRQSSEFDWVELSIRWCYIFQRVIEFCELKDRRIRHPSTVYNGAINFQFVVHSKLHLVKRPFDSCHSCFRRYGASSYAIRCQLRVVLALWSQPPLRLSALSSIRKFPADSTCNGATVSKFSNVELHRQPYRRYNGAYQSTSRTLSTIRHCPVLCSVSR